MRTPVSTLSLLRPQSLNEALAMMREHQPLTPLAGCTDVYVNLQFGTARETRFIDLWPLRELRGITADRETIRIGALATYSDVIESALVRRRLPMLAAAAREIGGWQIRNRGTVGGNLANASPAGDSLPVLAAVDAVLVLRSAGAERRVPFAAFYTGYRATVRAADELIAGVEIPRIEGRQYWRKVGTRRAQAISKVMCAAIRGDEVRVAFGSVGPIVARARRTERVLAAGGPLKQAQAVLRGEISPIDDIRSTADYRREVAANLLADFWQATKGR